MSDGELIVTMRHIRTIEGFTAQPGFCHAGLRAWFDRHGLDLRSFVKNGIPASRLEAVGDAFALATVRWARECESREAGGGQ